MSSVLRIVNATSTEASLAPGIDQLHSTNSWPGALQVYRGWNKQPCNCSKQRVCSMSLNINAVACSNLLRSKNGKKEGALFSEIFWYNAKWASWGPFSMALIQSRGMWARYYSFLASGVEVHLCKLYSSVGTFIEKRLERKAKPIIANPKANIGYKAKNVDLAQTITNEKWAGFVDSPQVKRKEPITANPPNLF